MEISEQFEDEEFTAAVSPGTTALVSTETAVPCLKRNDPCKVCIPCAFKTLHVYNMHVSSYPALYVAYKVAMTLSCTQVSCERLFSKLKLIKNRLRATMGEPHLESLMLLSSEERNFPLDYEHIINQYASSSLALQRELIV